LTTRLVNINEDLTFNVAAAPGQDADMIDFSTAIVYDYDIQGIIRFDFFQMRIRIWDRFSLFRTTNQLTLRISGADPHYQMPSIASINLNVNIPPINAKIVIDPPFGDALSTTFRISVNDALDVQMPLTYKYQIYQSRSHLQMDTLNGTETRKLTLQDFGPSN
jgi:hypothetical protein